MIARLLAIFLMFLSLCAASVAAEAKFTFQPEQPMIDDVIKVRLNGLKPDETVQIEASLLDELGRTWRSGATFKADKKGVIDLGQDAPVSGSYSGVEPMGLFWSMDLKSDEKQRSAFWHTSTTSIEVTVVARRENAKPVEGHISRQIIKTGVRKTEIRKPGLVGNLFTPTGQGPFPAVIVLGGSEGGVPSDAYVAQFANQGFLAFGLAYYRAEGLPEHLANLPLEYFKNAIIWLKARPEADTSRISIAGYSMGGVAALLVASHYPDINAVISIMGGPILFQSIDPNPAIKSVQSNFTLEEKALPFIPINPPELTPENLRTAYYLRVFLGSLFAAPNEKIDESMIPVENIQGPILLIGASNDRLFGSSLLNARAYNRLTEKNFSYPYHIIDYEGTGHTLGAAGLPGTPTMVNSEFIKPYSLSYSYGGNPKDTAKARADSWRQIFKFLKQTPSVKAAKDE